MSLTARLFLFMVASSLAVGAQPTDLNWSPQLHDTHRLLRQFEMAAADSALAGLPPSPGKAYLLNMRDFMGMVYSEDHRLYLNYLAATKERTGWIEQLPEDSPARAFYLADMKLQEALFKIRFGDYFSGLFSLWQANSLVSARAGDHFQPFLKPKGIINILIGLSPEKYAWALGLLGFDGDISLGVSQLTTLAGGTSPLAAEARTILGYFYAYPLQQPGKASAYFRASHRADPDDKLSRFLLATSLSKNHQGSEALALMTAIDSSLWSQLPTACYLMGDLLLQKGDVKSARQYYQLFVDTYEGENFKKDALCKIAASHLLEGNSRLASEWTERAYITGAQATEPDKNALVMLTELPSYPIYLLRARFHCDGGYWEEAMAELSNHDRKVVSSKRWGCEHSYRLARVYQLTGNPAQALRHYEEAWQLANGHDWYIGASAALQTGLILGEQGQPAEAAEWFRKALQFKNHPYKASIDSRAELELSRLRID